jgi:hypothetical protein
MITAQLTYPVVQHGALARLHLGHQLPSQARLPGYTVVDDPDAALADRAQAEFRRPRDERLWRQASAVASLDIWKGQKW